jgi:UDP-N-acetylmuramoyl-tripeptide--D-alanyl-D-alanine ligase
VHGLADVTFTPLRGDEVLAGDVLIVDDTYNANPAAVLLALDDLLVLAESSGRRPVAVLGDMLELGPQAPRYHREVGIQAARAGVAALIGVGPLSRNTAEGYLEESEGRAVDGSPNDVSRSGLAVPPATWIENAGAAADEILAVIRPGDVVLVKGSRGLKLDRLVEQVLGRLETAATPDGVGRP